MYKNKTAVISCGPSWRLFFAQPDFAYDTVIGCNWIAERIECDWVVCHDAKGLVDLFWPRDGKVAEPMVRGRPKWFLHWHALEKVGAGRLYDREDIREYMKTQHILLWPASDKQLPYTGLAALRLLSILAIDKSDMYGYDMIGTKDGRDTENDNRPETRWQTERRLFDELTTEYDLKLNMAGSK